MCVCLVNITPKPALFPARGKSRSLLESGGRRGSHRTHGPVQPVSTSRRATGAGRQREIRCGTPSMEDRREGAGRRAMKRLVLESTAPFQGLPELVAYDEGLFEKEGLGIEWADREKGADYQRVATNIITPKGLDPFL